MCTWGWWPCGRPPQEESPEPQQHPHEQNGQLPNQSNPLRPVAAPNSSDGNHRQGAADTAPSSTLTVDSPSPTTRPGQPANQVSMLNQQTRAVHQPGTPKAAPGPSYESDDECEGAATVEERLNDITRSVKSHANAVGAAVLDEAARRHAEEVAKRLVADRDKQPDEGAPKPPVAAAASNAPPVAAGAAAATTAPTGPAAATVQAVATPGPELGGAAQQAQSAAGPSAVAGGAGAGAAGGAQEPQGGGGGGGAGELFEIDLDIDLTKGSLKVDYSTRGLLGQGGFAAVYKGRYNGHRVAVKMIKKTAGSSLADLQEDMNALMHEFHILRQVNHPNIVTLYGGCLKPPHIFLVEERMEGTLDFYVHQVRKHDPLSVREVVYFALDIACGLSYLHPRIVHRDLKPANVLLSREGRCKISDFGLARTKIKEYLSTKNLDAGTTAYIAPECFMSMDNPDIHDLRRSVTDRTDIYALGIIMWEMLAGKRPWQGLKPLLVAYQVAYRNLRPPLFELGSSCPAKMRQLIEECWCQEPKQRPSSQQVVDRLLEIHNEIPLEKEDYAVLAPAVPIDAQQQVPQAAAVPGQPQLASHQVVSPHDVMLPS